jgi:hypothetical protein
MKIKEDIDERTLRTRIDETFQFGVAQLEKMPPKWPSTKPAPVFTENGAWSRPDFIWTDWWAGFYAGMMWLAFERTGEAKWQGRGEIYPEARAAKTRLRCSRSRVHFHVHCGPPARRNRCVGRIPERITTFFVQRTAIAVH